MESPDPVQVGTDHDWTSVSAGVYSFIALKSDGSLWSLWVGEGLADSLTAPVRIGTDCYRLGSHFSWATFLHGAEIEWDTMAMVWP